MPTQIAFRRTTTVLKAMQMRFGRYSACRAGLSAEQLREKHRAEEKGLDWQMPADALPLPAPTEVA